MGDEGKYGKDEVMGIIHSVINKIEEVDHISHEALFTELQSLAETINQTRQAISQSQPSDISEKHIQTATDELDAIIGATEDATGAIMDNCEKIEEAVEGIDEDKNEAVITAVTNIYEACTFQDITGQRISKVVSALKSIEEKVDHLLKAIGGEAAEAEGKGAEEDTRSEDEKLLNGPQMVGEAISQDEIDRLLADFD